MSPSFAFEPVEWITAGAVGPPGQRTFCLQARTGEQTATLLVEKEQVRRLAELAQELLARVGVVVTPDDLDTAAQSLHEPVVADWRAGVLSLGMDADGTLFLLEAEEAQWETTDEEIEFDDAREPATARFIMSRPQLVGLAAHAAYSVEAGARETCRFCSRPIDPVAGHVCPATNGHGPLTR